MYRVKGEIKWFAFCKGKKVKPSICASTNKYILIGCYVMFIIYIHFFSR